MPQQWRVFAAHRARCRRRRPEHARRGAGRGRLARPADPRGRGPGLAPRAREPRELLARRHPGRCRRRPRADRHHLALAAYQRFWEPHTRTDPQVRPLWETLRRMGIRVGVLSNTIWSRGYHREVFARDGVLDLLDADVYSSEIHVVKPHPEAFRVACEAVGVGARGRRSTSATASSRTSTVPQQVGMRAILVPHSDIPARAADAGRRRPGRGRPPAARRRRHRRPLERDVEGWNGDLEDCDREDSDRHGEGA